MLAAAFFEGALAALTTSGVGVGFAMAFFAAAFAVFTAGFAAFAAACFAAGLAVDFLAVAMVGLLVHWSRR